MPDPSPSPHLPADASQFVNRFLREVRDSLGDECVGMYAYGSVAGGDFDPASSDLDLVVALAHDLNDARLESLRQLHARLPEEGDSWAQRLEVWYMPVAVLRKHDPALRSRCACISTVSPFGETEPDESWVLNRHVIRESSPAIAGPPATDLIDPVDPDAIRMAVRHLWREGWSHAVEHHDWMRPRKYQAFTVLTMCRALHALRTGEIVSKPQAAAWAMVNLEGNWTPLIQRALASRADPTPDDPADTLAFVAYAFREIGTSD